MDYLNPGFKNIGLIHQVDTEMSHYNRIPLIITGEAAKIDLVENFDVEADKVYVVTPGMEVDWKVKTEYSTKVRNLLCVSNYLPGKGIYILITVLTQLKEYDWNLTIAGNPDLDPECLEGIKELVKDSGLNNRIELLGVLSREEINNLMIESDLLVNLSESETYGMAIQEAIHAGLPVLMYQTGAWREFEKSGLVTVENEYSVEKFRHALVNIFELEEEVNLGHVATNADRRTWEQVSREIESIIQNC